MKLKHMLITGFIVLIVLLAVVNNITTSLVLEKFQQNRLRTAEVFIAKSISNEIFRDVVNQDNSKLTGFLFDEKKVMEEKVEYILIFDKKGYLLAHTYLDSMPKQLLKLSNEFGNDEDYRLEKIENEDVFVYNIAVPIFEGIKQVGTVHLGIKGEYIRNLIKTTSTSSYIWSLVSTFIIVIFGVLVALFISFSISRSLTRLQHSAAEIAKGNLDVKINTDSKDETGELAKSFKTMAAELKKSKNKLENYSKNLEKQVKERTASLRKKEAQLLKSNKRLKELDVQKDDFISVAAHELKTPLTSIRGFAQLLMVKAVWKDRKKSDNYLNLINENTERLYQLVCDLVDSSRLSLGKITMNMETVKTTKLYNEIKQNMEVIIKEQKIKPAFTIEKNIPNLNCDYERTLQILRNLIINSVHFTGEGGKISLKVFRKGNFVQFEVADTGKGIPKENQKYIFSKFYQVDSSLRRKVGGSGLGLSVSKGFVNKMGGKIWFDSKLDKGTTFYFTIPISKERGEK